MIAETIGAENRRLAFELLWELIELHSSILELSVDSSGRVGDLFTRACYDLGTPGGTSKHRSGCTGC